MKNGIYRYLTAGILTNVLQKYSLSSPLPKISCLSKPHNLIDCHGNQEAKFAKKYSEIFSSEALRGMKLNLCRNVHNISLYKKDAFLLLLFMRFHCYGNLKFPLTYKGESENWPLLLCHCRYSDKHFTEMFLE